MGYPATGDSEERENTSSRQQAKLVQACVETKGQDRTDHWPSQERTSDESMPIQRGQRRHRQCGMGHVSLEHEESDKPIPAEGRKEGDKRDETGRITKKRNSESLSLRKLSSVVKEQYNKEL